MLTAAAGPLSLGDLVALRSDGQGAPAAADIRHVRRLVEDRAARSLERVGPAGGERYQFAHGSLLEYAQTMPDLRDPEYRQRIHHWAGRWRDGRLAHPGWRGAQARRRYLLDTYPVDAGPMIREARELASDIGWVEAAIRSVGVDRVLADLGTGRGREPGSADASRRCWGPSPARPTTCGPPQPVDQAGYVLRQLSDARGRARPED